jgi:hypothetical protein
VGGRLALPALARAPGNDIQIILSQSASHRLAWALAAAAVGDPGSILTFREEIERAV